MPHVLFTEGKGVIGAQHNALRTHDIDQQTERTWIEHSRVDRESVGIARWQLGAVFSDDIPVLPGVIDSAQQISEAPAAVCETEFQGTRQAFERAGENRPSPS